MNLLFLGVDSLRADHLSSYGYHRLTSPHMDAFAREGVLFENTYSAYIPTTPAYTSMLTGMDVMTTGVVSLGPKGPLDPNIKTLPEILKDKDYVSACIGFGEGFYRGFDTYEDYRSWLSWEERPGDKAESLNEKAIPRLEKLAKEQPFFLFLRHMDQHSPYLPPPPFDKMFYSKDPTAPDKHSMESVFDFKPFAEFFKSWMPPGITDADWVIAQYDSSIAYMDACIKRIFTRLEELGIADNTLVVITADHGETLLEHEIYFDHHGLYEPTLHVPLLIKCPGKLPEGKRIKGFTLHQDLMPTILDLLGFEDIINELKMDGKSAVPLIEGKSLTNYTEFYITECTWMRKRGWRTAHWKLIDSLEPDFHNKPPVELYNLIDDPLELNNVADQEYKVVQALKTRMLDWVNKRMDETGKPDPIMGYKIGTERSIGSISKARDLQDSGKKQISKGSL